MKWAMGRGGRMHDVACAFVMSAIALAANVSISTPAKADFPDAESPLGVEPDKDAQDIPDTDAPFALRPIADHLELPWAMAFLPDGRMLVTERRGRLRVIQNDMMLAVSIEGIPEVLTGGHSGLLDVLVDTQFSSTHILYYSYMVGPADAARIRIGRARLEDMQLVDKQVIFESAPAISGTDQIGGRIMFGPEGYIYMTIGERMQMQRAQNLLDDGGKIIRIRTDGSIPDDNPFVGRPDARPEIYSYGHRNPQGLIYDEVEARMWSVEQGPHGGDELNLIKKGANYGWPLATYGINYDNTIISDKTSLPGMEDPIHYWVPSVATASLVRYSGTVMPPDWNGSFLIGTLVGECLIRLQMRNGAVVKEERYLHHSIGRIRDVAVGPGGYIYLLTDGTEASLYRIEPLPDEIANRPPLQ